MGNIFFNNGRWCDVLHGALAQPLPTNEQTELKLIKPVCRFSFYRRLQLFATSLSSHRLLLFLHSLFTDLQTWFLIPGKREGSGKYLIEI